MKVKYIYLDRQYLQIRNEILPKIDDLMMRGAFILRPEVNELEEAFSLLLSVQNCVGVNSGTDALYLGIRSLKIEKGSEVIVPSHTYISSIAAIKHSGLIPVLVDIKNDFNIDKESVLMAITNKTRAIMVTHMNGRICDMDPLMKIAKDHNLFLVEDAAQAIGATYKGSHPGSFSNWAAFSLHPMKTLGCAGDGGFLATNDNWISDEIKMMRNLGQRVKGIHESFEFNSRLDTLQAGICLVKLNYLSKWIERRKELAAQYTKALINVPGIITPPMSDAVNNDVFSSYVIRAKNRDELKSYLQSQNIETMISWPMALHKAKSLGLKSFNLPNTDKIVSEVLSLPIAPETTNEEQSYVIDKLIQFYEKK